jgi:hypothetical protein
MFVQVQECLGILAASRASASADISQLHGSAILPEAYISVGD